MNKEKSAFEKIVGTSFLEQAPLLLRDKGLSFDELGLADKTKYSIMVVIGLILAIFGNAIPAPNMGVVVVMYAFVYVDKALGYMVDRLGDFNSEAAKSIQDFISQTPTHRFAAVFVLSVIVSILLLSLFNFFTSTVIFVVCIAFFVCSPGQLLLVLLGITNKTVQLVIGIIIGLILSRVMGGKFTKVLLAALFAIVGSSLILGGLDGFSDSIELNLPRYIIELNTAKISDVSPSEFLLLGILVFVSVLIQLWI